MTDPHFEIVSMTWTLERRMVHWILRLPGWPQSWEKQGASVATCPPMQHTKSPWPKRLIHNEGVSLIVLLRARRTDRARKTSHIFFPKFQDL